VLMPLPGSIVVRLFTRKPVCCYRAKKEIKINAVKDCRISLDAAFGCLKNGIQWIRIIIIKNCFSAAVSGVVFAYLPM